MSESLPAPLVPAEVDLRGLEYMPLLGARLFGSDFHARATDAEWRAALTLWWAAWQQVPAGSLPDDDVILCRLAELGRDLKGWKKVKARALHGFERCSDGRLYHSVLCEQVAVAWDKRVKERQKKAAWRRKQAGEDPGRNGSVPVDKTSQEPGRDGSVPADGTGRDGTGRLREDGELRETVAPGRQLPPDPPGDADPEPPAPSLAGRACLACRGANVHDVNTAHPDLLRLLAAGVTPEEIGATAAECAAKGKARFAYVLATVERRRAESAARPAAAALQADPMAWADSRGEVIATALRLGLEPFEELNRTTGHANSWPAYRRRVVDAWQAANTGATA